MKKKIIRAVTADSALGFVAPLVPAMKEKYEVQLLSSPGTKFDEICHKYDVKGHAVYMFRRMSPFKDLRSLWQLIKVFRNERPYLVHSMTPKAGLLCMLAAWITRVPHRVHTFTGLIWPTASGLKRKLLIFTDWITCACATQIIPEGKGVMNDLSEYVTDKPMRILGYGNVKGVDLVEFSLRDEVMRKASLLRDNTLFTFLFVGRIVGDKGINELISAYSRIHREFPETRLLLVGNYEADLDPLDASTLDKISCDESIVEVGPQYGDDLIAYYAASDCFVFPSYREGFPNVVLEAGAMRLPSIVTDVNGSREIIENGRNGLVIRPRDDKALYEAMKCLLSDSQLRSSLAANAHELVSSHFERSFVQKCLMQFYEEIM